MRHGGTNISIKPVLDMEMVTIESIIPISIPKLMNITREWNPISARTTETRRKVGGWHGHVQFGLVATQVQRGVIDNRHTAGYDST